MQIIGGFCRNGEGNYGIFVKKLLPNGIAKTQGNFISSFDYYLPLHFTKHSFIYLEINEWNYILFQQVFPTQNNSQLLIF